MAICRPVRFFGFWNVAKTRNSHAGKIQIQATLVFSGETTTVECFWQHQGEAVQNCIIALFLFISFSATCALAGPGTKRVDPNANPEANAMLRKALHNQHTWEGFPGFRADFEVNTMTHKQTGRLFVSAEGKVELKGIDTKRPGDPIDVYLLRMLKEFAQPKQVGKIHATVTQRNRLTPFGKAVVIRAFGSKSYVVVDNHIVGETATATIVPPGRGSIRTTSERVLLQRQKTADGTRFLPTSIAFTNTDEYFNSANPVAKNPSGTTKRVALLLIDWQLIGKFYLPRSIKMFASRITLGPSQIQDPLSPVIVNPVLINPNWMANRSWQAIRVFNHKLLK